MAQARLNLDQFFSKLAGMEETELRKALWTLYWRGTAPLRQRIEGIIDPGSGRAVEQAGESPPDARLVLEVVTQFAASARSGSYLAGDRRVSPKERSRWRFTFRRLSGEAQDALRGKDFETAAAAVALSITRGRYSRPSAATVSIGSQGRRCRVAVLVPHPPFNPCVRFSRTRLTDGLLCMVTPPSGIGWCP